MIIHFDTIKESAHNLGYGIEKTENGWLVFNLADGPAGGGVVIPSPMAIRRMLLDEIQRRLDPDSFSFAE